VARCAKSFRDRIAAPLRPPESAAVELVSREVGVSMATPERWRAPSKSQTADTRASRCPKRRPSSHLQASRMEPTRHIQTAPRKKGAGAALAVVPGGSVVLAAAIPIGGG
jgi:hypothetical protein